MPTPKNRLAARAHAHPVAASLIVMLLYIILRRSSYFLFRNVLPQTGAVSVIYELVDAVWPFLLVAAFGCLRAYRKGGFFRTLLFGIPLILYGAIPFVENMLGLFSEPDLVWQTPLMMLWGIVPYLFIGFREESVFRGIVIDLFADKMKDRRGVLTVAVFSAFLFGIMHMQNVFIGQTFFGSLIQSVNAFFLGLLLVAVYLRGGNLWALMLIHAFIDFGISAKEALTVTYRADAITAAANSNTETSVDAGYVISMLIFWALYTAIALFLLRKKKCGEIVERFSSGEQSSLSESEKN